MKIFKLIVIIIGSALLLCVGAGFVFGFVFYQQSQADHERKAEIELAQRKEVEEKLARMQREFENASRKEQELERSLLNANDEVEGARIKFELDNAKMEKNAAQAAISDTR